MSTAENAALRHFLSFHILRNVAAAYLVFVWHTVLDDFFQMVACFYTVEQWFLNSTNTPNPYVVSQTFVEPHFAQYNTK